MILSIAGLVVITAGIALVAVGTVMAWRNSRRSKSGLSDMFESLSHVVAELAKHPISIRLIVLGIVLILIGGVIAGVGGLTV